MWNSPLTKTLGVVAPSAADWSLGEIMPVFTTTAVVPEKVESIPESFIAQSTPT